MYKITGQKIKSFSTMGSFYDGGIWIWVRFENKDGEEVTGKFSVDQLVGMADDFVFEVFEAKDDGRKKYDHLENPVSVYDDDQEVKEEFKELF